MVAGLAMLVWLKEEPGEPASASAQRQGEPARHGRRLAWPLEKPVTHAPRSLGDGRRSEGSMPLHTQVDASIQDDELDVNPVYVQE